MKKSQNEPDILSNPIWDQACIGGVKVVREQIKAGFPVNAQPDNTRQTILSYAALNGQVRVVKYLLRQPDIDVSLRNWQRMTVFGELEVSIRNLEAELKNPQKLVRLNFDVKDKENSLEALKEVKKILVKHIEKHSKEYEFFGKNAEEIITNLTAMPSFREQEKTRRENQAQTNIVISN